MILTSPGIEGAKKPVVGFSNMLVAKSRQPSQKSNRRNDLLLKGCRLKMANYAEILLLIRVS
jgi:hypothetical protein